MVGVPAVSTVKLLVIWIVPADGPGGAKVSSITMASPDPAGVPDSTEVARRIIWSASFTLIAGAVVDAVDMVLAP